MITKKQANDLFDSKELFFVFLTANAYLISYIFTSAYLSEFNIPRQFVEISPTRFILGAGITLFVFFISLLSLEAYLDYEKHLRDNKRKYAVRTSIISLIILITTYILGILTVKNMLILCFALASTFVLVFLSETLRSKNLKIGFQSTLLFFKSSKASEPTKLKFMPERLVLFFFLAFVSAGLATVTGTAYGFFQNEWPVLQSNGDIKTLIIDKNNGEIISKDINVKSKKFNEGFKVMKLERDIEINEVYIKNNKK